MRPQFFIVVFIDLMSAVVINDGGVTTTPLNTVTVVGSSVKFSCRSNITNSSFRWYYFKPGNNQLNLIHSGIVQKIINYPADRFKVEFNVNDTGLTTLVIEKVQSSDAGIYCCYELASTATQKATAELIVLDTNLICQSSPHRLTYLEFDNVIVTCKVTYSGNWSPSIGCNGTSLPNLLSDPIDESMTSSGIVLYRHLFQVTPEWHQQMVECKLYFSYSKWNRTNIDISNILPSNNLPVFDADVKTWTTPQLNVLFGVRNASLHTNNNDGSHLVKHGDNITCIASGNPQPDFEWTNNLTYQKSMGAYYVIDLCLFDDHLQPSHNKYNVTLRCSVKNSVGRQDVNDTYQFLYTNYVDVQKNCSTTAAPPPHNHTLLIVCGLIPLGIMLIIIICKLILAKISRLKGYLTTDQNFNSLETRSPTDFTTSLDTPMTTRMTSVRHPVGHYAVHELLSEESPYTPLTTIK